jgi:hypothetical protein
MIYPPSVLRVRVEEAGRRRFRLWLPLFVIWPFALLIALLLSPFVIVASALLWPRGWGRTVLLIGPHAFRLFCALRGLEVDVHDGSEHVLVSFR